MYRTLSVVALFAVVGSLVACAPKSAGTVRLDQPAVAAVVGVLSPLDGDAVQALPDRVTDRLDGVLAARNLTARPIDLATASGPLFRLQTTDQRAVWLAENAGGAKFIVLF